MFSHLNNNVCPEKKIRVVASQMTEIRSITSLFIVIALCLQYELKGYPRKFLELLTGTPPHLTLNQVSYHSAESTEEIA